MQDRPPQPVADPCPQIKLDDDIDLLDWAERLGVSLYEIRVATADVGSDVELVRQRLKAGATH